MINRDDASPVLAAAALTLAKDPDPKSGQALADAATQEEKWLVRAASFDAIARRGDPSLLSTAVKGLQDKKEEVQYSAAGSGTSLGRHRSAAQAGPKLARSKSKMQPKK